MVTPNFCTSSSSLLSTLLTATFSYCSRSKITCKRRAAGIYSFLEVLSIPIPPWPRACREEEAPGTPPAAPTSLPTKESLFSKISARYCSPFLWKKL